MRLIKVYIKNFRCIEDSNAVEIGATTCLVGKNESGKTAFLKALEGVRSVDSNYVEYNKLRDYPRRYYTEYDSRHEDGEAVVAETVWEFGEEDISRLEEKFGKGIIIGGEGSKLKMIKTYEMDYAYWEFNVNEKKLIKALCERYELSQDEKKPVVNCETVISVGKELDSLEEKTESQNALYEELGDCREGGYCKSLEQIIDSIIPKFLYFSHYDRMSGEVSVNHIRSVMDSGEIEESDQVFLDFLEYANTTLDELADADKFEELNARCEAAANSITRQIFEYWTQNDQLEIEMRFSEGSPGDPPPFESGPVARARVRNNLHNVTVPFSERSAGFIWFFSFLVKFAQIKKKYGNVIILLDEPGLTLHGNAQKDLLRYFKEKLEPNHQLIYTTHSPFIVPADDFGSVRTVEDVIELDDHKRPYSIGTKIKANVLVTDPQTSFPLLGAMGYAVAQTLIIGPNTLLVEGPGDVLYLQAFSRKLESLNRAHLASNWAVCPAGGIDKIAPFVRLFHGNDLNMVVLTDFDRSQKKKIQRLYEDQLLEKERTILTTHIVDQDEADIEDFFEPELFVKLLNASYNLVGKEKLTVNKLMNSENGTNRLAKKAEAYFRTLPDNFPEFGHHWPAHYLLTHPELLEHDNEAIQKTLSRFEEVFHKIAKFA